MQETRLNISLLSIFRWKVPKTYRGHAATTQKHQYSKIKVMNSKADAILE